MSFSSPNGKNPNNARSSTATVIGVFTILLYFTAIQARYITLDLWNDEIYTFKFFILNSYHTILTDYHVPNNHIFLNLFYKLYTDAIGITTLASAFEHPFLLRLPQLLFAYITIIYTFRSAQFLLNDKMAFLSLLLLITCIPYNNFALQIRGYNLSMMIFSLILYQSIRYLMAQHYGRLAIICVLTSLLMYTVPSNLYTVIAFASFFGFAIVCKLIKKNLFASWSISTLLYLIVSLVMGVLISLLLYWPVIKLVFFNEYVSYLPFRFSNIIEYLPRVVHSFNSNRDLLFLVTTILSIIFIRKMPEYRDAIMLLLFIFLMPFVLVFILGNNVPDRVFVTLAPVFAMIIGFSFQVFYTQWLHNWKVRFAFTGAIVIYSIVNLHIELNKIDRGLMKDIETEGRRQDLYYNYYQAHFRPADEVKKVKKDALLSQLPVFIIGCEPHDIPHYLEESSMKYFPDSTTLHMALEANDSILLVTNHPNKIPSDSLYSVTKFSRNNNYHTFFIYWKIKSEKQAR